MTSDLSPDVTDLIRVKVLGRHAGRVLRRQLPDHSSVWGRCSFSFDPDSENYDWLVVYDDLPPNSNERRSKRTEHLRCAPENTLLVTTEPESIKSYFTNYTRQFNYVLTSQPEWALPHPNRVYSQPALRWFYGIGSNGAISFDQLRNSPSQDKSSRVATVCSVKQQKHTLHDLRYNFTQELRKLLPELEVFGRGVREIDDKAGSIAPYKYHLAIENHIAPHHWTEKLSDPFLGEALPFYIGCPNASDYFPKDSYIPLDINDVNKSAEIIREAISSGAYEKRRDAILKAKNLVIMEYNLFSVLSRFIESSSAGSVIEKDLEIRSRRLCIDETLTSRLKHAYEKLRLRSKNRKSLRS